MTDINPTSSYGGARVDEMLPEAEVANLMRKMTPPKRTGRTARLRRAGLTASKADHSAKKHKSA